MGPAERGNNAGASQHGRMMKPFYIISTVAYLRLPAHRPASSFLGPPFSKASAGYVWAGLRRQLLLPLLGTAGRHHHQAVALGSSPSQALQVSHDSLQDPAQNWVPPLAAGTASKLPFMDLRSEA